MISKEGDELKLTDDLGLNQKIKDWFSWDKVMFFFVYLYK